MQMEYLVRIAGFGHCYPDKTSIEIRGVEFTIAPGERVAILGGNGSGKSTLLNHLTGLLSPTTGQVLVMGYNPQKDIRHLSHQMGIVLQAPEEQLIGPTVFDDVAFAPRNAGWPEERVGAAVNQMLEQMGIEALAHKIPHYLSGGEQQKVALAGALIMQPKLLILDEPFSRLDIQSKASLVQLLNSINSCYGTAILCTLHDTSCLSELVDKVYLMKKGCLVARGRPESLLQDKELLEGAGLAAPPLVELTEELRKQGLNIPYSLDYKELAKEISKKIFFTKKNKQEKATLCRKISCRKMNKPIDI